MREIKFRAWVKSEKRMITDYQEFIPLIVTNKGVMKLRPEYEADLYGILPNDWFELMQYTGLKDKNGMGLTEVFEGDIISEDGILKGNIYENDKRETDIVVPQLGTKDWETTYKEIVVRGYDYSE